MKFTKEEISLCKQIAKKHRKGIDEGDWGQIDGKVYFFIDIPEEPTKRGIIPLWSISDCLEFLEEKKLYDWSINREYDKDAELTGNFCFWWKPEKRRGSDKHALGKTLLEAFLKVVLAVLEGTK